MRDDPPSQHVTPLAEDEQRDNPDAHVHCPFCRSEDVELISLFGPQLSTDQYYCRACRTPFERLSRD